MLTMAFSIPAPINILIHSIKDIKVVKVFDSEHVRSSIIIARLILINVTELIINET